MSLTARNLRDVEAVERRALAAFRLVDKSSGLPIVVPATITPVSESVVPPTGPPPQPTRLMPDAVVVRQNRRGWFVILSVPQFGDYAKAFLEPVHPPTLPLTSRLKIRLAITNVGPHYFPRLCDVLLPRSLDPNDAESVFVPQAVELLRTPCAPLGAGCAELRIRAVRQGTRAPLGGVLLRAFRHPRTPNPELLGIGLTEWRDEITLGEGLVPLPSLLRFAPGAGANVFDTTHSIELEATRDPSFPDPGGRVPTGAQLPDVDRLEAADATGLERHPYPAWPLTIAAGRPLTVDVTMP